MKPYNASELEPKWLARWRESGLHRTPADPKRKYYVVEMLPYPSGDIHMGHFRNYSIGDAVARFRRMQGYDVLYPFGWDAFGQPAEQAAIKHRLHPRDWTIRNIETGRATLQRMGLSYDWDREIIACRPDYYRWTQWIFLLLHRRGLAYLGTSTVNFCPACNTVLADEEVWGGGCWRCKGEVQRRPMENSWYFRITQYAERLLRDLDRLDGWPENVRTLQRNWIGRSEGCRIVFRLQDDGTELPVFTTRPDTVFGVTALALAPEHPLVPRLATPAVDEYVRAAKKKTDIERTAEDRVRDGVFTGRFAVNPFNGEAVPLWVADYVLAGYGTGIVMCVPAHDRRDFAFARRYGLPIRVVIQPPGAKLDPASMEEAYVDPGVMTNSGPFDGLPSGEGIERVTRAAEEKNIGGPHVQYRLRDWLISRQRYWGCPIPMIHCEGCGPVPVPEKDLPVLLPDVKDFLPKGRSPLADVPQFMNVRCPACGGAARRSPDTMVTFVDSGFYLFRYLDPRNDREPWSREAAKRWMPIDLYIGGVEHACGHLIYLRFLCKVLYDEGWLPVDEPVVRLYNHGMVLDERGDVMSKSRGNVVSPAVVFEKWGVDVARLAMFSFAPSNAEIRWSEKGLVGADRFLRRVWALAAEAASRPAAGPPPPDLPPALRAVRRKLHQVIRKFTSEFETDLAFNTAIARASELLNLIDSSGLLRASGPAADSVLRETAGALARLLAPLAPFAGEEMWEALGGSGSVFRAPWPVADEEVAKEEMLEIVLQVNGKVRGRLQVAAGAPEGEVRDRALQHEAVRGRTPKKVVVVPGRLVSIVV